MAEIHAKPWEPEEFIGSIWHRLVGRTSMPVQHNVEAVTLESMRGRMGLLLRGLGGDHGFAIAEATARKSVARRTFLQRIGHVEEVGVPTVFGRDDLQVPDPIALFDRRSLNEAYCLWLAVWPVAAQEPVAKVDGAFASDVERLRRAACSVKRCLSLAPGLKRDYAQMCAALLAQRPTVTYSIETDAMEQAVRHLLGDTSVLSELADRIVSHLVPDAQLDQGAFQSGNYSPFRPVALWPDWISTDASQGSQGDDEPSQPGGTGDRPKRKRARRHPSDQSRRGDSLIINRFETIKTWAEMLNLARRVEDEDDTQAQKAADDQEELGLSQAGKSPSTRLVFDLDLSPEDVLQESLAEGLLYPEWDFRKKAYLPQQSRVLETIATAHPLTVPPIEITPLQRTLIAQVRRMFEALRPQRAVSAGETEGSEIDIEQTVRFACDRSAGQTSDDRLFKRLLTVRRNLAVVTLVDVSRSTESVVEERPVIDTARESLLALAHGVQAVGDRHAIYSFSSLHRSRVFVSRLKDFDEPVGPLVEQAIGQLRPGHYTRLGPAIRHMRQRLSDQPSLTDVLYRAI